MRTSLIEVLEPPLYVADAGTEQLVWCISMMLGPSASILGYSVMPSTDSWLAGVRKCGPYGQVSTSHNIV
jgi:hypothetical protein